MDDPAQDGKYIRRRGNSYQVRLPVWILPARTLGSFSTFAEAQIARDCALNEYDERLASLPQIDGWTNEDDTVPDADELWARVVADQARDRDGVTCYGAIGVGGTKMRIHRAALQRLFQDASLVLDAEEIYAIGCQLDVDSPAN